MKTQRTILLATACLWLCGVGLAQRTWVVDSLGGSGVDFTDLPPAVAAAAPGDTLWLRPGDGSSYDASLTIDKGIRIIGNAAAPVRVRGRCVVQQIPDDEVCVFHGIDLTDRSGSVTVHKIEDCRGLVLVSRLRDDYDVAGGANAWRSARVVYTGCRLVTSHSAMLIDESRVLMIDCDVRAPGPAFTYLRQAALWMQYSYVSLVGGYYKGADVAGNGCVWGNPPAEPGVRAQSSQIVLAGGVTIQGGYCAASLYRATAFLQRGIPVGPYSSWHVRDPDVRFVDSGDTGVVPMTRREITSVFPRDAARGQPQTIDVEGPSNGIVSVYASLAHGYAPIALPVGDVWLDPSLTLHVSTGPVDVQRRYQAATRIPSWLPIGTPLVYQAVALTSRGTFELSTPGFAVVE